MGKPDEDGSRKPEHKGSAITAFGAMILAACAPANADNEKIKAPEAVKVAAIEKVVETTGQTCSQIEDILAQLDCENAALDRQEASIDTDNAARTERIETKISDNAAKISQRQANATEITALDTEIKEGNTTVKVLSEIRDEAFDKNPSR